MAYRSYHFKTPSNRAAKMEEMSVPLLFEQARKIHQEASGATLNQDNVKKGCTLLSQCEEMIGKLGLFSSHQTKDDISTTNLKYLLVPYYLAELTVKVAQDDRMLVLKASQAKLKEFVSFCEALDLVPGEELETFAQGNPNSLADIKAKKIARIRLQKAAECKLLEIRERNSTSHVDTGDEETEDNDAEEEREAWLTILSLTLCKAFDLLELLKKEEEMLSAN